VIALLAALLLLAPPDESFRVAGPETPVLLGRRFEVVVSGPLQDGATLAVPELPEGLAGAPPALAVGAEGSQWRWPLRALREGDYVLAGLAVESGGERHALPDVPLSVVLDLPPGALPEVAPPLPPVRVPYARADLRWIAAGLVAALLLLGLAVARAGRPVIVPPPLPRPPELIAAEALARLRGRLPRSHDEVPAFVVEVSGVLRAYIEGRFGVRAPEETTEEFLPLAAAHPALAGQRERLASFLTGCDLVKFARHRPEPSSMGALLVDAEAFVETTALLPAGPPAVNGGGGAT
jgi:hypothetical protein